MKATQFILPLLIVTLILSCEKLEIETAKDTSFILSEETKDGVLYVDGVAQVELIKDINLTDATLNEGLLKVESLTKLFSTMKGLAKYNSKSLESFYVQNDLIVFIISLCK